MIIIAQLGTNNYFPSAAVASSASDPVESSAPAPAPHAALDLGGFESFAGRAGVGLTVQTLPAGLSGLDPSPYFLLCKAMASATVICEEQVARTRSV